MPLIFYKEVDDLQLEKIVEGLQGPSFWKANFRDYNPLTGQMKIRFLHIPNAAMRLLHKRIIRWIRSLPEDMPYATGGRPGFSPLLHIERHCNARFIYHIDLKDAYGSVRGQRLANLLCELDSDLAGQEEKVFEFLTEFVLSQKGGLATGPNAAPDLFNLYCHFVLDESIAAFCQKWGLTYNRYLDDLTISGLEPIGKVKKAAIRCLIRAAGFQISDKKTHYWDLEKGPAVICGIGLEFGGRLFVPRPWLCHLRGLLFVAKNHPGELMATVEGKMGLFRYLTSFKTANKTEREIYELYRRYRHYLKLFRRRRRRLARLRR